MSLSLPANHASAEFLVACLCAEWCGTCREYRPAFADLARKRPDVAFVWVDVEDEPEVAGDVDVENFPTLVIQRANRVLYCGPSLPDIGILARLLDTYGAQTPAESAAYIAASAERQAWQEVADVRGRLPVAD